MAQLVNVHATSLLARFAPWGQGKLVPQVETHPDGKPLWNKVKVGPESLSK